LVNDMDERIRADDVPRDDITTVLTFGDGVVRYLEAIAAADELIEAGNHDAAQEELVRAAVAFDTMTTYGEAIEDAPNSENRGVPSVKRPTANSSPGSRPRSHTTRTCSNRVRRRRSRRRPFSGSWPASQRCRATPTGPSRSRPTPRRPLRRTARSSLRARPIARRRSESGRGWNRRSS